MLPRFIAAFAIYTYAHKNEDYDDDDDGDKMITRVLFCFPLLKTNYTFRVQLSIRLLLWTC